METGRSRATGFIVAKSSLVQMSCSGTNGHTLVCSCLIHSLFDAMCREILICVESTVSLCL